MQVLPRAIGKREWPDTAETGHRPYISRPSVKLIEVKGSVPSLPFTREGDAAVPHQQTRFPQPWNSPSEAKKGLSDQEISPLAQPSASVVRRRVPMQFRYERRVVSLA